MKTRTNFLIALAAGLLLTLPTGVFAAAEQTDAGREETLGVDREQGLETEREMGEPTGVGERTRFGERGEAEIGDESPSMRIQQATATLREMIDREGDKIPPEVIRDAQAVAIFPDLTKAGMIVGGRYGEGVLMVKHNNNWNGPVFLSIYGASIGAQLGVESTDMVMVFTQRESLEDLRDGTLEFGAEASVTAGSAGAKTRACTEADILGYQNTAGLFAGVSLSSGYIAVDDEANQRFFREEGSAGETRAYYPAAEDILAGKEPPRTRQGGQLADILNQYAQQTGQGQEGVREKE